MTDSQFKVLVKKLDSILEELRDIQEDVSYLRGHLG